MGIGIVSISTSQKNEQTGPPFVAASANNGLSVDSVTGKIVLGNDAGAPGNPAQLLNTREIFGNGFNIRQRDSATEFTNYNGGSISINQLNTRVDVVPPNVSIIASTGIQPSLTLDDNTATFATLLDGTGIGQFKGNGVAMGGFSPSAGAWQFGPTLPFNNATVQVNGGICYRVFVRGPIAGVQGLADVDTGELWMNSGALQLNLPTLAAGGVGYVVRVAVQNAGGIVLQMNAGQAGFLGGAATTVGGTYQSVTVGSCINIVLLNATTWVAESSTGVWVLT